MNITRCSNGHFYDADKYIDCPHCQKPEQLTEDLFVAPDGPVDYDKTVPVDRMTGDDQPYIVVDNNPSVPPSLANAVDDVQKTISISSIKNSNSSATQEPAVGWLVCVDGPLFAADFKIKAGRNFVGRSTSMDIVLDKDAYVSRDKHCIIVFDPASNDFIIQAGDSKELSYLNDKVVLSPTKLSAYDKIKLGGTTLVFVPLCCDQFKWADFQKED